MTQTSTTGEAILFTIHPVRGQGIETGNIQEKGTTTGIAVNGAKTQKQGSVRGPQIEGDLAREVHTRMEAT